MEHNNPDMLRQLQSTFRNILKDFASSQETFRIVQSVPESTPRNVRTLYVLDSSFNPPSKAHLLLAQNAIGRDNGSKPARMLFLLATQNADKKYKPAANEDRLVMMTLMAKDLYSSVRSDSLAVDVGITKEPFFVDKAKSIDDSGNYGDDAEQVHVTGYDTIVRIFDTKYYPEDQKLRVLDPFLNKHRLRVTYRLGDKYGTKEDQDAYVESIADGSREAEGMRKEWRDRIDLVDDAKDGEGISSTEARKACVENRHDDLTKYVSEEVSKYIQQMDLYQEPGAEKK